jgi:hypothetical protein
MQKVEIKRLTAIKYALIWDIRRQLGIFCSASEHSA